MKKLYKLIIFSLSVFMLIATVNVNTVYAQEIEPIEEVVQEESSNKPPLMGWASWNAFRIGLNEEKIKEQTDLMVKLGFQEAGYEFINIDDGYFGGRDENDVLYPNSKFPNGMKHMADYIHDAGFKAGIYTDAGVKRCASYWDNDPYFPEGGGTYGFRDIDFETFFIDWGFDFVKVDWCGGDWEKMDLETEFTDIANKIAQVEKDVLWELCSWAFPGEWATDKATHWRISGDIAPNFGTITSIVDLSADLAKHATPGHYNHMDMLEVGNGMTYDEDKSHFSMWSIMNSPLLISTDLTKMTKETIDILTNKEVIAVNQDSLGIQAERITRNANKEVWAKPVKNYEKAAVALFNRSNSAAEITVNWSDIGLSGDVKVRDLWLHEDMGTFKDSYTVEVPKHGIVMLEVAGDNLINHPTLEYNTDSKEDLKINKVQDVLLSIKNGDYTLVKDTDYTVSSESITLNQSFLVTLTEGLNTLKANYSGDFTQNIPIKVQSIKYSSENLGIGNNQDQLAKLFDGNIVDNDSGVFKFSGNKLPENQEVNIQYNFGDKVDLSSIEFSTNYGADQGIKKFKLATWDDEGKKWNNLPTEYTLDWQTKEVDAETLSTAVRIPSTSKIKIIITEVGLSWGNLAMRSIDFSFGMPFTSENLGKTNSQTELAKLFDGDLAANSGAFTFDSNKLPNDKEVNVQYDFKEEIVLDNIKFSTNYGQDQGIKKFKLSIWNEESQTWNNLEKEYTIDWKEKNGAGTEPGETVTVNLDISSTSKIKIVITDAGLTWGNQLSMREIAFSTRKPANNSALTARLEDARLIDTDEYTESTVSVLMDAITLAETTLASNNPRQSALDAALAALNTAIEKLEETPVDVVDTDALTSLINHSKAINRDEYTEESVDALEVVILESETLLGKDGLTQVDVDEQVAKLQLILDALAKPDDEIEEVDTSKLDALISKLEKIDLDGYTAETVKEFKSVLSASKILLTKEGLTEADIITQVAALQLAFDNLEKEVVEPEVNTKLLEDLINKLEKEDLKEFTPQSIEEFKSVLEDSKVLLKKEKLTDKEVRNQVALLQLAFNNLEKEAAKTEINTEDLKNLIVDASVISSEEYTEASIRALKNVIKESETLLLNQALTQEQVNAQVSKLQLAIKSLELVGQNDEVDTSVLRGEIKKSKEIDTLKYTKESVETLNDAISKAESLLKNDDLTEAEVSAALSKLNSAIRNLEKITQPVPEEIPETDDKLPSTGMEANNTAYIIGGFVILLGLGFVWYSKKKNDKK